MLPEPQNNKMIDPSADDAGKVTLKAVSGIKNEYHFPGVPNWKPLSVIASTYDEALAIWKTSRLPVNPEPEKVEEAPKEITKEQQ
jgi:hypothetical protein